MAGKHLTEARAEWKGERETFYAEHFGKVRGVVGGKVDVCVVGPDEEREGHSLLVTNGLSDHWMEAPPALSENKRRVELILYCRPLELGEAEGALEVQLIQRVAAIPLGGGKALSEFLAAPFSTPAKAIADGSKLTTPILLPPMFEDGAVKGGLELSGGERVTFLWLDFLTTAEFNYRMASGSSALLKKFQEKGHSPVLDVERGSYL